MRWFSVDENRWSQEPAIRVRPGLQELEVRETPAVSVTTTGSTLTIKGDAGGPSSDQVAIQLHPAPANAGDIYQVLDLKTAMVIGSFGSKIKTIVIDLGDQDDSITIDSLNGSVTVKMILGKGNDSFDLLNSTIRSLQFLDKAALATDSFTATVTASYIRGNVVSKFLDGSNTLTIAQNTRILGNFGLAGGAGAHALTIEDHVQVAKQFLIALKNSDDQVTIRQSRFGQLLAKFSGGDNTVEIENTTIATLGGIFFGDGNDELRISDSHMGKFLTKFSGGSNTVDLADTTIRTLGAALFGSGDDQVQIRDSFLGKWVAKFNGGNNTVAMAKTTIATLNAFVFGGGDDEVHLSNSQMNRLVTKLGDGTNTVLIEGTTMTTLCAAMFGSGNDSFTWIGNVNQPSKIGGKLLLDLGAGNDSVVLGDGTDPSLAIGGLTGIKLGAGDDQLTIDAVIFLGQVGFAGDSGDDIMQIGISGADTVFHKRAFFVLGKGDDLIQHGQPGTVIHSVRPLILAGPGNDTAQIPAAFTVLPDGEPPLSIGELKAAGFTTVIV